MKVALEPVELRHAGLGAAFTRAAKAPAIVAAPTFTRSRRSALGAAIGAGARLVNEKQVQGTDGDRYYIRGGIIVVPKGAVIPDGTVV